MPEIFPLIFPAKYAISNIYCYHRVIAHRTKKPSDMTSLSMKNRSQLLSVYVLYKKLLPGEEFALHASSESMKPLILVGDLVFSKRTQPFLTRHNDVIVFFEPSLQGIVIHRIQKKFTRAGKIFFQTKGDANNDKDPWIVEEKYFLGKVNGVKRNGKRIPLSSHWLGKPFFNKACLQGIFKKMSNVTRNIFS